MQVNISKQVQGQLYVHIVDPNGNSIGPDGGDATTSWSWSNLSNGNWTVEIAYQAPNQNADNYTFTVSGGDLVGYGAYLPAACQLSSSATPNSVDVSWGNMPGPAHWAYTAQVQTPSQKGF